MPEGGGVYISYYLFGSPAHKYKLVPKQWVIELNGEPVRRLLILNIREDTYRHLFTREAR